jgi:hypothetical protein
MKKKQKRNDTIDACVAFSIAIMAGIEAVKHDMCEEGRTIEVVPLSNALVSVLAHLIAGIPDEDDRMWHFARIGQNLFDAIKGNVEIGAHADLYNQKDLH